MINWNKIGMILMLLALLVAVGGASLTPILGITTAGLLFLVGAIIYYLT
jgi:hypothetical protein